MRPCERRHRGLSHSMSSQPARREGVDNDYTERKRSAPWFRLDADFLRDDKIEALMADHGPAGPLVFLALMGAAKRRDDGGLVTMGWQQLSRGCYVDDVDAVQQIVGACEEFDLLIVKAQTTYNFTAQIVKWDLYQRPADPTAAARQRKRRAKDKAEPLPGDRDAHADLAVTSRVTDRDGTVTGGLSRDDRDIDKDSSGKEEQPLVAPAAAALHPAFADVMAIAQEACSPTSKMLPPTDTAILSVLNAYPDADHLQAARLAAADVCAGLAKQPHFHRILGWKLSDQVKAPRRQQPVGEDYRATRLAALKRLQEGDAA